MSRNLKAEEKKAWILENCINEYGDIDLKNLDFNDVEKNVLICNMTVNGKLDQSKQKVTGDLLQSHQKVQRKLHQSHQTVQGNLYQDYQ